MAADSTGKTIGITVAVSLVASILVSTAAVKLKPIQEKNKILDKKKNVLIAAGLYKKGINIEETFNSKVTTSVIDLKTGEKASGVDPSKFDAKQAAKDPDMNISLTTKQDVAGIGRIAKYATVYTIVQEGKLQKLILPMHGKGLWSTMYGFLALSSDINTVEAVTFYEHGETPGLGGEIDNPSWKKLWIGKKVFNDQGKQKLKVIKGKVDQSKPQAKHEIDGISGATLTIYGVDNTIQFWLGDMGYAAYLQKIKSQSNTNSEKGGK